MSEKLQSAESFIISLNKSGAYLHDKFAPALMFSGNEFFSFLDDQKGSVTWRPPMTSRLSWSHTFVLKGSTIQSFFSSTDDFRGISVEPYSRFFWMARSYGSKVVVAPICPALLSDDNDAIVKTMATLLSGGTLDGWTSDHILSIPSSSLVLTLITQDADEFLMRLGATIIKEMGFMSSARIKQNVIIVRNMMTIKGSSPVTGGRIVRRGSPRGDLH